MPQADGERTPRPGHRTILVVPETGLITEAVLLFQVAMQAARVLPAYHLIIRCHPIMPFDRLRPYLHEDPRKLANLEISTRASIVEDFLRSSVLLYRGSSSVLYAILYGVKPIYVRQDQLAARDPLVGLATWRESVSTVDELKQLVHRYSATDDHAIWGEWRAAVAYVRSYAVPVSDSSLDQLLELTGRFSGPIRAVVECGV